MGILLWLLFDATLLLGLSANVHAGSLGQVEKMLEAQQEEIERQRQEIERLKRRLDEEHLRLEEVEKPKEERVEEAEAKGKEKVFEPLKAGFGKIQMDGLAQTWFAFSEEPKNTFFRLRRIELKFSGEIFPKFKWVAMIDPAKALSLSQGPPVTVNQPSNILQDFYVSYDFRPYLRPVMGQTKVPLSMEGQRSSAELYTVERALFNTLPLSSGRVGDVRDTGFRVQGSYPLPFRLWKDGAHVEYDAGIFNDSGPQQNFADLNDQKAFIGRALFFLVNSLHVGMYGATGGTSDLSRDRLGGELSWQFGRHILESEFVTTSDGSPSIDGEGWYFLYGFHLNPKLQAVARYELWNPDRDKPDDSENDFTLGLNWLLVQHRAKIQLNWVHKDIDRQAPGFLGKSRELVLLNWQASW